MFDLSPGMRAAARFMTITCNVKEGLARDEFPAVVHVDGSRAAATDRTRAAQPLPPHSGTLAREKPGCRVLVNTSFNVHEEPIIDTPAQALEALAQNRVDLLIVAGRLFERRMAPTVA